MKPAVSNLFVFIMLCAAAFLIYSNVLDAPFQFDDYDFIVNNPQVKQLPPPESIVTNPPRKLLTLFTFHLNYAYAGFDTLYYHVVNVMLHACTACLFYVLITLLLRSPLLAGTAASKEKTAFAAAAALIFLVHPLQTESVTYIWQRSELLCGFFYMASFVSYMKARTGGRWPYYAMSAVLFTAGLFAKETIVSLPIAVAATEIVLFGSGLNELRKTNKKALAVSAAAAIAVTVWAAGHWLETARTNLADTGAISVPTYLFTQFRVMVKYIQLSFFPVSQNVDYYFPPSISFFTLPTVLSFMALSAVLALTVLAARRQRLMSFGIFLYFSYLIPTSSVLPAPTLIFEHRLYVSIAGFAVFVTALLFAAVGKKALRNALLICMAVSFAVTAYARNFVWQSTFSLMEDTVKKSPLNARPHLILGGLYLQAEKYEEAERYLLRAAELAPAYPDPYNNLGLIYMRRGDLKKAEGCFSKAVELKKDFVDPYINWAMLLLSNGNAYEAKRLLSRAAEIRGMLHKDKLYIALGNTYFAEKRYNAAIRFFKKATALNPESANAYYNMGNAYFKRTAYNKAIKCYEKAAALQPDFAGAYANLGLCYYFKKRNVKAVRFFKKSLGIDPHQPAVYRNLANTFHVMGKFGKAEKADRRGKMLREN